MMSDSPNESPTYQPVNVFVYLLFSSVQIFSPPGISVEPPPPLAGWLAGWLAIKAPGTLTLGEWRHVQRCSLNEVVIRDLKPDKERSRRKCAGSEEGWL